MADVRCPNCGESFHETTENYRDDITPNGSMLRLKDYYRELGWSSFPEDESTIESNLTCPACEGEYRDAATGMLVVQGSADEVAARAEEYHETIKDAIANKKRRGRTPA